MVMSHYEWEILELADRPQQTNKTNQIKCYQSIVGIIKLEFSSLVNAKFSLALKKRFMNMVSSDLGYDLHIDDTTLNINQLNVFLLLSLLEN